MMKQDKQALYLELEALLARAYELANEIVAHAKANTMNKAA